MGWKLEKFMDNCLSIEKKGESFSKQKSHLDFWLGVKKALPIDIAFQDKEIHLMSCIVHRKCGTIVLKFWKDDKTKNPTIYCPKCCLKLLSSDLICSYPIILQ